MDELKTLKDFIGVGTDCVYDHIRPEELRAEAVKWVKKIIKDQANIGNYKQNHMNPRKQGQISFIKHFFNLTEEDLKEK